MDIMKIYKLKYILSNLKFKFWFILMQKPISELIYKAMCPLLVRNMCVKSMSIRT